ncbi:hypothetical protein G7Y89_g1209 [Cudoniella acicularis]|uniref:Uncharacterized protein n=1 Tax=Cudoniella acicularis TaxID=354080 RepID=A0A8H4RWU1_9HELO|nr:hypothetical protein G7Y89_g1209 [Cudoniella acicularis]
MSQRRQQVPNNPQTPEEKAQLAQNLENRLEENQANLLARDRPSRVIHNSIKINDNTVVNPLPDRQPPLPPPYPRSSSKTTISEAYIRNEIINLRAQPPPPPHSLMDDETLAKIRRNMAWMDSDLPPATMDETLRASDLTSEEIRKIIKPDTIARMKAAAVLQKEQQNVAFPRAAADEALFPVTKGESSASATRFQGKTSAGDNKDVVIGKIGPKKVEEKTEKEIHDEWEALVKSGREDYDTLYEKNLLEMTHGLDCKYCKENKPAFAIDPPEPTWTVNSSVKPPASSIFRDRADPDVFMGYQDDEIHEFYNLGTVFLFTHAFVEDKWANH